jgi:hypothetical protein
MSRCPDPGTLGAMRIEIELRPAPAPCGEVTVDGGRGQPFEGWLQLLAILGDALPRPQPRGEGHDGG